MQYIVLVAVIGILLLQLTGSIPMASVGGPMVIALAFFTAALAVAIHEAWTMKRGALGWLLNVLVAFAGAFVGAQLGGMVVAMVLSAVGQVQGSLARTGGALFSVALAGGMLATILGSWGALRIVNRWR